MPARVELKIYFDTICEYNAFCAGNGMSAATDVEHDPVADGSVEAETPAPAPAAPASGKKRGRPAKAPTPAAPAAAEETPPAEPEPPVEAPAEPAADDAPATLDDAMAAGARLIEACNNTITEAQAILKSMGVARVSALESAEQFAEFIRRCDEAVAAKGAGAGSVL